MCFFETKFSVNQSTDALLFFRPVYSEFIDVCIGTFTSVEPDSVY